MTTRALPYRTASDQVSAEPWVHIDDGAAAVDHVPSWDYGSVLHFSRRVTVDVDGLRAACGFGRAATLALNVRYWPSTSLLRHSAAHVLLNGEGMNGPAETVVEIEVAGADLAGSLVLETTVVLVASSDHSDPFIARRSGSVLWREQDSVRLEGTAGLLPIAPVSFKEQGLPERAAWYVSVDSAEWDSAAMGNLLVLLNDDNERVNEAIRKPNDPGSTLLWDALTVDVVYDLVSRALEDEEFPEHETPERDGEVTTAALILGLVRAFLRLPNEPLPDAMDRLREERRRDPSRLRARVQHSLQLPGRGSR
ncbi:hypothetical protein [Dactylosporangium sp. NPDC051541]|uniref:hypothetical protein n=1 Tax=Dactylosporangium sp. NPDC051541 TaxID=3363977 RepID=UPI00379D1EAA